MKYPQDYKLVLRSNQKITHKTLDIYLKRIGFRSEDDFYYLPRKDVVLPWQASSIVTIDVRNGGEEVYEPEDDDLIDLGFWDTLLLNYLWGFIPSKFIDDFLDIVSGLSSTMGLSVFHNENPVSLSDVEDELKMAAREMNARESSLGSENLAILISLSRQ